MHFFIFSVVKMYYLHKASSAESCVKPNASQWEATLRDGVGFPTVYRRIYRPKFLTLSKQTSRYIRECFRMMYILHVFHMQGMYKWPSSGQTTLEQDLFNPDLTSWRSFNVESGTQHWNAIQTLIQRPDVESTLFQRASAEKASTQQIHNVATTSLQRRCNVVTLQRRCNDVVVTFRFFMIKS